MNVQDVWKPLARDWERVIFWGVALLFLLSLSQWTWGIFGEEAAKTPTRDSPPSQRSLLNASLAFAFRRPPPEFSDGTDPFRAPFSRSGGTGSRPWSRPSFNTESKPAPKPVAPAPAPATQPQASQAPPKAVDPPKPPPPTPPPPAPPPPKKKPRTIEYRGCMSSPTGKQLALVQDVDSKKVAYVQRGDKIGEFTVTGFSVEGLSVTGPGGTASQISFGQQKKIQAE